MFTDPRDGKTYRTVKIGSQVWMAENLNFDCPGSECYDNDPKNAEKYGRLYGWETAKKACPPGWHLPDNDEWEILKNFTSDYEAAGKMLKAKNGWNSYKDADGNGTDRFGFAALPGGLGQAALPGDLYGRFVYVGNSGHWWSASQSSSESDIPLLRLCESWSSSEPAIFSYSYIMRYDSEDVRWYNNGLSHINLLSVRCIKD